MFYLKVPKSKLTNKGNIHQDSPFLKPWDLHTFSPSIVLIFSEPYARFPHSIPSKAIDI